MRRHATLESNSHSCQSEPAIHYPLRDTARKAKGLYMTFPECLAALPGKSNAKEHIRRHDHSKDMHLAQLMYVAPLIHITTHFLKPPHSSKYRSDNYLNTSAMQTDAETLNRPPLAAFFNRRVQNCPNFTYERDTIPIDREKVCFVAITLCITSHVLYNSIA